MTQTRTPETPILWLDSDTGLSADDRITRDNTPTVIGTAEAGSTVKLVDSLGEVLGTTTANAAGHYSFVTPVLTDGFHPLAVTATAPGQFTSSLSSSLIFAVDTAPPPALARPKLSAASDTGVSHSDGLTGTATPVIVGPIPSLGTAASTRRLARSPTTTWNCSTPTAQSLPQRTWPPTAAIG